MSDLSNPWYFSVALILCVILAGWILWLLMTAPGRIARRRGHKDADAVYYCGLLSVIFWPLWPAALIWAYTGPNHAARAKARKAAGMTIGATAVQNLSYREPGQPGESDDGPGRFRVTGVDPESGADVSWTVQALSQENAKVRAQVHGIIVTKVQRV